jgi:hypothetical protein
MNLQDFRSVIQAQIPYDEGYMFLAGVKYYETEHFLMAEYDTARVPYIVYQEEGFTHWLSGQFIDVNKGFISERTVGALNRFASYDDKGQRPMVIGQYEEMNNRRGSLNMIKQGALDKITSEGMD